MQVAQYYLALRLVGRQPHWIEPKRAVLGAVTAGPWCTRGGGSRRALRDPIVWSSAPTAWCSLPR